MTTKIILPVMGEGVIEATLVRWLVAEGDQVEALDPIAEVETDKVTTEINSDIAGTITSLRVAEGETVPVETVLAELSPLNGDKSAAPQNGHENGKSPHRKEVSDLGRISPLVGRIAAENEIDLSLVHGTGLHGRITKNDVLAFLQQSSVPVLESKPESATAVTSPPIAAESPSQTISDGDLLPHSSIRRAIAEHMVRSKQTSPHVTTVFEFDFSTVSAHLAAHKAEFAASGARLTYMAYIVAATVQALRQHPLANSSWTDDGIVQHRAINVGMAVAREDGLIVPVIKGADGMNLLGLARAINDLAGRARAQQLRPDEVRGGTFSITNHGTSGSLLATPIINQPQAGILGIGLIEKRVKVLNDAIAIRPLAYASFTFDHRILDGASADAFVSSIKERIENWA